MATYEDDLETLAVTVLELRAATEYLVEIYTHDVDVDVIYLKELARKAERAARHVAKNCEAVLRDVDGRGARLDGQQRLDRLTARRAAARRSVDKFAAAVDARNAGSR